jgi:hypothetical protein
VSAALGAALKQKQALEIALQANRGDSYPPTHVRVWTDQGIAELNELHTRFAREDDSERYLSGRVIYERAALNALARLAEICDLLDTPAHHAPSTVRRLLPVGP